MIERARRNSRRLFWRMMVLTAASSRRARARDRGRRRLAAVLIRSFGIQALDRLILALDARRRQRFPAVRAGVYKGRRPGLGAHKPRDRLHNPVTPPYKLAPDAAGAACESR